MTPCTEPGEIVSEISFDIWPDKHGYDFREFAQRHGDFAIVGVGALVARYEWHLERAAVMAHAWDRLSADPTSRHKVLSSRRETVGRTLHSCGQIGTST